MSDCSTVIYPESNPSMQVDHSVESYRPVQHTYGRKAFTLEQEKDQDASIDTAAASSSSPSRLFESSPRITRDQDIAMEKDRSCNTTISSEDEEMDAEDEDEIVKPQTSGVGKRSTVFRLSDEEDDDEDSQQGTKGKESDAEYLKRFREARMAKTLDAATKDSSAIPLSSDLSEPPTLTNSSLPDASQSRLLPSSGSPRVSKKYSKARAISSRIESPNSDQDAASEHSSPSPRKNRTSLLPNSLEASSQTLPSVTSSPYITEAQKQQEARFRKESREARVKELAMRKARANNNVVEKDKFVEDAKFDDDDEVQSSTSDIPEEVVDDDDDDLPSALVVAQMASNKRRQAEQEAKRMLKNRTGQHGKTGVLQMRTEDDESDEDLTFRTKPTESHSKPVKALSKKEEEQMRRTQARIERELKANQAKSLKTRGERPVYRLSDLLTSIDQHESSNKGTIKTNEQDIDASNSSDPIESASDEDIGLKHNREPSLLPSKSPSKRPDRFNPTLKDLSPTVERGEDDVEDFPDAKDLKKDLMEDRLRKSRMEALRERKAQILSRAAKQTMDTMLEEEDIELVGKRTRSDQLKPRKGMNLPPASRQRHTTDKLGSPNGISETESDDDIVVTDGQIQRAGKLLHSRAVQEQVSKQSPSVARIGRLLKSKEQETKKEEDLNAAIIRRARMQNIELRRKREAAYGRRKDGDKKEQEEANKDDVADMIRKLRQAHESSMDIGDEGGNNSEGEGSEYNPDDDKGKREEVIDLGSGEEDEYDEEEEEEEGGEEGSSEGECEDSEKENSAPASQESIQIQMPRRSRITIADDEVEQEESMPLTESLSQKRIPLQPLEMVIDEADDLHDEEIDHEGDAEMRGKISEPSDLFQSSSDNGFSQFFQETQLPGPAHADNLHSSSPPRHISATLGEFFEETQTEEPLRGESYSILEQKENDESDSLGFSQFFNEGTQIPMQTNRLMPPPSTSAKGLSLVGGTDQDAFAALRKAQESDGQLLDFETDQLPSLEDARGDLDEDDLAALELEALRAEVEEKQRREEQRREEANVTYINKDGFFTQTKPDYDRYSFSQSQSQPEIDKWDEQVGLGSSLDVHVVDDAVGSSKKKRRFRRAISIEEDEDEDERQDSDERRVQLSTRSSKERLMAKVNEEAEQREEETDDNAPLNAFDILKVAMAEQRQDRERGSPPVKRLENRFVQGEAEESDDEEDGPAGKKGKAGRGGLGGIFSDDEGGSGSEEEENDEEDGKDLEELIDEEKDEEEAEKDELARERYWKDREQDDQAALALHEKAIRGGLRSKRRALNMDGTLEGFLDEDYEDDWLEKTVKNPYGNVTKKRKLKGKDGLDLLEANEESQAFVRKYREGLELNEDLEKYRFLIPMEEEEVEESQRQGSQIEEDSGNDDQVNETQTMSHQQLKLELQERRKRKRRQAIGLSDEEEEEEEKEEEKSRIEREEKERRMMMKLEKDLFGQDSDDDDDYNNGEGGGKEADCIIYDRLDRLDKSNAPQVGVREEILDAEEEAEHTFFALNQIASVRTLSDREKQRFARLQNEYANEPEWGNDDNHKVVSSKRSSSSTAGSVTSFGKESHRGVLKASASSSSIRSVASTTAQPQRTRSKLLDVMSRQSQFSESQE